MGQNNQKLNFARILIKGKLVNRIVSILVYFKCHPNNYLIITSKYFIYHLLSTRG